MGSAHKSNPSHLEREGAQAVPEVNPVVALHESHSQGEESEKEARRSGLDRQKMFVTGRDEHCEEHVAE